jgi:hypothetical protein
MPQARLVIALTNPVSCTYGRSVTIGETILFKIWICDPVRSVGTLTTIPNIRLAITYMESSKLDLSQMGDIGIS